MITRKSHAVLDCLLSIRIQPALPLCGTPSKRGEEGKEEGRYVWPLQPDGR